MAEKQLKRLLNVLSTEIDKLKGLRDQIGEQRMPKWLRDVESNEQELKGIRKAIDDVDNHPIYQKAKERDSLTNKLDQSIKHVKTLNATYTRNPDEVEKFISGVLSDKPQRFTREALETFVTSGEVIGSGEYGKVYKGKIGDRDVAVKVLKNSLKTKVKETQFIAEVGTLMEVSHRNLVKLYGFCFDPNTKAFVYEYIENGSLDKYLYENHSTVEWRRLYGIMVETAMGISYLHEHSHKGIIHRDINSSNVLLDKNDTPKIADFGLAKFYNRETGHTKLTTGFMGTKGFDAPEVRINGAHGRHITNKCDVFSFGVMLFEMLNMRKLKEQESFPKLVWEKFEEKQLDDIMTECGIGDEDVESAKTLAIVALSCTQFGADDRPSMSDVVKILEGEKELPKPRKPFLEGENISSNISSSIGGSASNP